MTAFSGRRFSVFANQSKQIDQECDRVGHTEPDSRGYCYRCGQKVVSSVAHAGYCNASKGPFACGCKTVILPPFREQSCTEKDHRFNGSDSSCACGTTRRQTIREELHAR